MKQMFKHTLWIIFVLIFNIGCTLTSRETVDLEYKESKLLETLARGPFKSLEPGGNFNKASHNVWDFDVTNMEATIYVVEELTELQKVIYTFDIIEDVSIQEGVIRLYGAGPNNDKYVGISALTNADGVFLKFSAQDKVAGAVSAASDKPFWEYASEPTIFRVHNKYLNQDIVSLDAEGFFDEAWYTNIIPEIVLSAAGEELLVFKHTEITTDATTGVETKTPLADIIVETATLIPANTEIYTVTIDGATKFVGIEYYPDKTKTVMKFIIADSFENAQKELSDSDFFGWDLKSDAKINNKVIRLLSEHQMVKLTHVNPAGTDLKDADYFWDKTDELIFDADEMTLNIITTLDLDNSSVLEKGITNYLSYDLKMIKKESDTAGIFEIKGAGKYNNKYGVVNAIPILDTDIMYADFEVVDTENEADNLLTDMLTTTTNYSYQDVINARRPYRLAEEMDAIGHTWARLYEDVDGTMSYDPNETERYTFVDLEKRTLEYEVFTGNTKTKSYYKVKVIIDNNKTNGVFLLEGVEPDFVTPNTTVPMHNKYIAIDKGTEIYKTQAKYAVGDSLEEAQVALTKVPVFNLHESITLPINYKIIVSMENSGPWVALKYENSSKPGDITDPTPEVGAIPNFIKTDTYQLTFDTTDGPQFSAVIKKDSMNDITAKYNLSVEKEYSNTHAVFEIKHTSDGADPLSWGSKFMAIRRGVGATLEDKAYIAIGGNPTEAENELKRIGEFYNYHLESTVPINASVIKTVHGIPYIQSETNASDAVLNPGLPNGTFKPFNTKYYYFSYTTLQLTISNTTPTGESLAEVYNISYKVEKNDYSGVVQLSGNGSLDKKFMRIDVQRVVGGYGIKNSVRLLVRDDVEELTDANVPINVDRVFTEQERTHINNNELSLSDEVLQKLTRIHVRWTAVDDYDKMYDYKNGQELEFDIGAKTVQINMLLNGVSSDKTYNYIIMEGNYNGPLNFNSVLRLSGTGPLNNQYMALEYKTPTRPPFNNNKYAAYLDQAGDATAHGAMFAFGKNYNLAKNQLAPTAEVQLDPYIPYYDPYTDPTMDELENAFTSYLKTDDGGYGRDSFVWMKNGIYDVDNTETWLFNPIEKIVSITHNDYNKTTIDYSVHMLEADTVIGGGVLKTRPEALFYLRAAINPAASAAPYNRHYISITNHKMSNAVDSPKSESTFYAAIDKDREKVEELTQTASMTKFMRDQVSANVETRAFDRASLQTWVRLDESVYQLNNANNEVWEFRFNNEPKVRITKGGVEHIYAFNIVDDISSHRGVFKLSSLDLGRTADPYDNHMVAIGLGGEQVDDAGYITKNLFDSNSMRLAVVDIVGDDEDTAKDAAIAAIQAGVLPEWNFRNKALAETHFNSIMKAAAIDLKGWVRLEKNTSSGIYEYKPENTERWIFGELASPLENINGSKIHDLKIASLEDVPVTAETYGIKLIKTTDTRAEFQIFRGSGANPERTNTFVVLEIGVGVNEKLMRVGMATTSLADAEKAFDDLGTAYNWSAYGRATAESTTIVDAIDRGKWSLTRSSLTDETITGSAITTPPNISDPNSGHYPDSHPDPRFDKNDLLEYEFRDGNQLYIHNKVAGVDFKASMVMDLREIPAPNSGIYLLRDSSSSSYDNYFMYIEFKYDNSTMGNKGRVSIAKSIQGVKNMHALLDSAVTWNFFTSESIKIKGIVFEEASRRHNPANTVDTLGAYVALGYKEDGYINIYDTLLTKSYTIIPSSTTIGGKTYPDRSIIISNVAEGETRDDTYFYEMVESETNDGQWRAIAQLIEKDDVGKGPDKDKFIGIRLPAIDQNAPKAEDHNASIVLADTLEIAKDTLVNGGIDWGNNFIDPTMSVTTTPDVGDKTFRYRSLKDAVSGSTVLEKLKDEVPAEPDSLVTLDEDGIYLYNENTEWSFPILDELKATIITKTIVGLVTNSNLMVYKTVKVKSTNESATKGVLYLKGAGGLSDKKYVAITINNENGYRFRYFDTFNDADADLLINSTSVINLELKSKVHFPTTDSLIAGLIKPGKWNSLSAEFKQIASEQTTNFTFLDKRKVKVKIGNNNELDLRFKPVYAEGVGDNQTPKAMIQIVATETTPVPPILKDRTIALAVHHDLAEDFEALRLVISSAEITDDTARDALILARDDTLKDPNYMIDTIFMNDPKVSKTIKDAVNSTDPNAWYLPMDEFGTILPVDDSALHVNFAFRTVETAPPTSDRKAVYNFEAGQRYVVGDHGTGIMSTSTYFTKVIQDDGPNSGVIQTYGKLSDIFNLSNQYIVLQAGTEENMPNMKLAKGDTREQALQNLSELTYFNYAPAFTLGLDVKFIQRLSTNNKGLQKKWIERPNEASPPPYDPGNTTEWEFSSDGKSAIRHKIVDNVKENPEVYSLKMVRFIVGTERSGSVIHNGVFRLIKMGGVHNGKYMAVNYEVTPKTPTAENPDDLFTFSPTGKFAIKDNIGDAQKAIRGPSPAIIYQNFHSIGESSLAVTSKLMQRLSEMGSVASISTANTSLYEDHIYFGQPAGYYETNYTETFNFSYNQHENYLSLVRTWDGKKSYYSYKATWQSGSSTGLEDRNRGTLYIEAVNRESERSILDKKYLAIDFLHTVEDDRILMGIGSSRAKSDSQRQRFYNRRVGTHTGAASGMKYPYSYWTHEPIANLDLKLTVMDRLREIALEWVSYDVQPNWDINELSTSMNAIQGFRVLTDKRFYKANSDDPEDPKNPPGAVAPSRVRGDGYWDPQEHYRLEVFDISGRYKTWNIFPTPSTETSVWGPNIRQFQKTIEYENDTQSTILLHEGAYNTGYDHDGSTQHGDQGIPETRAHFKDTVMSFTIDDDGHVIFGTANPGDGTRLDLEAAIAAAKKERDDKSLGIRKNTPTMVPSNRAMQQKFVPHVLKTIGDDKASYRTFVNDVGLEIDTATTSLGNTEANGTLFSDGTHQLSLKFNQATGTDMFGSSDNHYATLQLKPINSLNRIGTGHEWEGLYKTDFLIQTFISGRELVVFQFHRPTSENTGLLTYPPQNTSVTFWDKLIIDKYHAIQQGTGANMFQHKWAYGDSVEDAQNNVQKLPFYNGSFSRVSSGERRENFERDFLRSKFTVKVAGVTTLNQDLTAVRNEETLTALGTDYLKLTPYKEGKIYLMNVEEFDSSDVRLRSHTYEIFLKYTDDTALYEDAWNVAISFSGMGRPLNDLFMLFNSTGLPDYTRSDYTSKMMFFEPKNGADFNDYVEGFLLLPNPTVYVNNYRVDSLPDPFLPVVSGLEFSMPYNRTFVTRTEGAKLYIDERMTRSGNTTADIPLYEFVKGRSKTRGIFKGIGTADVSSDQAEFERDKYVGIQKDKNGPNPTKLSLYVENGNPVNNTWGAEADVVFGDAHLYKHNLFHIEAGLTYDMLWGLTFTTSWETPRVKPILTLHDVTNNKYLTHVNSFTDKRASFNYNGSVNEWLGLAKIRDNSLDVYGQMVNISSGVITADISENAAQYGSDNDLFENIDTENMFLDKKYKTGNLPDAKTFTLKKRKITGIGEGDRSLHNWRITDTTIESAPVDKSYLYVSSVLGSYTINNDNREVKTIYKYRGKYIGIHFMYKNGRVNDIFIYAKDKNLENSWTSKGDVSFTDSHDVYKP